MVAFFSEACARVVSELEAVLPGVTCDSDSQYFYHHTEPRNLPSIARDGALKPSPIDEYGDGSVNLTVNPDFHRFGSLRLVLDREEAQKAAPIQPMCYTFGEDEEKRSKVVDAIYFERSAQPGGRVSLLNWIAHEIGVEPGGVYGGECKHFTREPVPLTPAIVRAVEYWLPWRAGDSSIGANVIPCNADWTAWSTGKSSEENVNRIEAEIFDAKKYAHSLGAAFEVRTCYPYASIDRTSNDSYGEVLPLDKENLTRLELGFSLDDMRVGSRHDLTEDDKKCLCHDERAEVMGVLKGGK